MKIKFNTTLLIIPLIFLVSVFAAQEDSSVSAKFTYANNPDEEMIFIKLRRSLFTKMNPGEEERDKFSIAEYYFKHNDFSDAFSAFSEFAKTYHPDESTLLAKVYLYKIALIKKEADLASSIKKGIFDNSFILLFSKFKKLKYKSAFNNNYEIHYYLDKIKVFLNGELFEEINP